MTALPEGLPPWANAVAAIVILVGFGLTHWLAVIRKASERPESQAATVLSATLADGQAVRDLIHELRDAKNEAAEQSAAIRTLIDVIRGNMDEHRATRRALEDLTRALHQRRDA